MNQAYRRRLRQRMRAAAHSYGRQKTQFESRGDLAADYGVILNTTPQPAAPPGPPSLQLVCVPPERVVP